MIFHKHFEQMDKNEFRNLSALVMLTTLVDKVENPAKVAVFWADELTKELYDEEK